MEGLIDERKTPERGGETLAVREKVEKKSDVSVVVVEFLQLTVVVCRAFPPEVPHDPPQFSHRGNQQPGCVVEIEEEIEGEQDNHYHRTELKQNMGWYPVSVENHDVSGDFHFLSGWIPYGFSFSPISTNPDPVSRVWLYRTLYS